MFKELIQYYLGYFQAHGEAAIKVICNCVVPCKIILEEYRKLPPIEMMPDKNKKEMKQYVLETFPDKSVEEKLQICKVLYTVGTLL